MNLGHFAERLPGALADVEEGLAVLHLRRVAQELSPVNYLLKMVVGRLCCSEVIGKESHTRDRRKYG